MIEYEIILHNIENIEKINLRNFDIVESFSIRII